MKHKLQKLPTFSESLRGQSIKENFSRYRGHKIKITPDTDGKFAYEVGALIEGQSALHFADGYTDEEIATAQAQRFIDEYQENFVSGEHSIVSQERKFEWSPALSAY